MCVWTLTCVSQIRLRFFCLGFLLGRFCVLLQATVLGKPKHIVRNEMENGYTERHFICQTYLTEPQGIIKK